MDVDSERVCETLHTLYLHAQTDRRGNEIAKAALAAELNRLLYATDNPNEGARAFLVNILYASVKADESGVLAAQVDEMAFGLRPNEHPENRRAAGIVHVTLSSQAKGTERKEKLKADAKDVRLDDYPRSLAGVLLVQEWRAEMKQNADMGFYAAKAFMDNETDYLRATRVEVAKFLLDFCKSVGKAFPVVAEIVTSGKWPELADDAGRWLIDHFIKTKNLGEANRIAEAPKTSEAVKDYAAKRFDEIGFRPIQRARADTITGMPAFKPDKMREKIARTRGVPPSIDQVTGRRATLTGPVK